MYPIPGSTTLTETATEVAEVDNSTTLSSETESGTADDLGNDSEVCHQNAEFMM